MVSTSRKISEWEQKLFKETKIRLRQPEWRILWKKKLLDQKTASIRIRAWKKKKKE